jgi:DNA-binding NarL/FixJ family response regulator
VLLKRASPCSAGGAEDGLDCARTAVAATPADKRVVAPSRATARFMSNPTASLDDPPTAIRLQARPAISGLRCAADHRRCLVLVADLLRGRREIACVQWAVRGKSAADIAETLRIKPRTVVFHMENARQK